MEVSPRTCGMFGSKGKVETYMSRSRPAFLLRRCCISGSKRKVETHMCRSTPAFFHAVECDVAFRGIFRHADGYFSCNRVRCSFQRESNMNLRVQPRSNLRVQHESNMTPSCLEAKWNYKSRGVHRESNIFNAS